MDRTSKIILGVILVLIAVAVGYHFAWAQEIDPVKSWDPQLQQIINQLIGVGMLIATGVLSWAGMAIRSYFASKGILAHEQTKDVKQSFFNQAAYLALALFETMKKKATGAERVNWSSVDKSDPHLKAAAEWMMKAWPEATAEMTLNDVITSLYARVPSGPMTERVADMAEAKAGGTVVKVEGGEEKK